jgi:hypothetical protein
MANNEIMQRIKQVNDLLEQAEPDDISVDSYSGFTGYKPQYIIDAMNEVFGIGEWGFDEISNEVTTGEKGGLVIAQVRMWLKGIEFKPTGWGQARITKGDVGDAKKGAQTDAFKKASSYFSIGNRAYRGLLPDGKNNQQNRQQNAARSQQQAQQNNSQEIPENVTSQQLESIRKLCQYLNKKEPDNVTSIKFLAARKIIQELTAEYKEKRQPNKAS